MESKSNKNWDSMFLPDKSKESLTPHTPKEGWQFEKNLEFLKKGLLQYQNISQENLRPEVKQEQRELVSNFDRLRRSILQHKESNRNLVLKNSYLNGSNCDTSQQSKMYHAASMEFKKEISDSASKVLPRGEENEVSAVITMPLTERGRHGDKYHKSSKERKSSHRKKSKDVGYCKRHPQKRLKYI